MPVDYGGRYYTPRQQQPPGGTTTTGTTTPTGPISGAIDDVIAGAGAGGGGGPQPLGVSTGFRAAAPRQYATGYYPHGYSYSRGSFAPGSAPTDPYVSRAGAAGIPARYFADDEYMPANFSSGIITQLQQQMAYVGLFDANASIISGDWGEESATAFRRLLAYANQHGMTYRVALTHLRTMIDGAGAPGSAGGKMRIDEFGNIVPGEGAGPPQRAPLVTRTTDPRTLEIVFRESSMNLLGQALSPDQISMMTSAFNQMEVQRQQEAYDKELTGGSVIDIPSPEAYAQSEIERTRPGEVAEYRGLNYLNEAMGMLASPAWGIGRG